MTINYDFIAFSGRLTENSWSLGMKAIQGEVPLDVVIPSIRSSSNSDEEDIIGVLTKEGISRESNDVMELYRYLRQLNPKSNQVFGFNEVVIRNIHTRLNSLKINDELHVQITYTERKENYSAPTYNIKLLGIFEVTPTDIKDQIPETNDTDNIQIDTPIENILTDIITNETPQDNSITQETQTTQETQEDTTQSDIPIIPKDFNQQDQEMPVYKTTNTLEKLIIFTRTLQSELNETKNTLAAMVEQIQILQNERERYRELQDLIQDMLDRITYTENFENRIITLEMDHTQLKKLQHTLLTFYKTSNRHTQILLNEINDDTNGSNPDNEK
ncbi:hypothetical protein JT359_16060 [Candidatus Poribacteria bacterium]|nr:hypothetical protein [Candidatus Poribacteria bacterium]